jgi:Glycosyltransferase family 29 (sialyltransferase)
LRRFDVYDFRDAWAGVRSVAVVGNAATILQWENGALIDSHDMVIRFNRAQTTGIEDKIGSRTDVLIANDANSLGKGPSPADTLKPGWVVCFTLPGADRDIAPFRTWAGDVPTVITFAPEIAEFSPAAHTRGLTMGTYALYALLKLFPLDRLFVTGFTMYGAVAGDFHKYYGPRTRGVGTHHDLDQEARLFSDILASFKGELHATAEVVALLKRFGHRRRASGALGAHARPETPTLHDRLLGGLAWRLLTMGFKLRRRIERGSSVQFEALKKFGTLTK